jgi:DNA-binding MarR family transcriptional regulator
MTRWLSEDEQATWRAYLAASQLLSAQLQRELLRDAKMPHGYYEILVRLSEAPSRTLRMSDLADAADSSRSRLSHAIAKLESQGWVQRETCETDRRGSFAVLTDAGFAALESAAPGHVETVRQYLFDRLTPEQTTQLRSFCDAVIGGLRDTAGACALLVASDDVLCAETDEPCAETDEPGDDATAGVDAATVGG